LFIIINQYVIKYVDTDLTIAGIRE